MDGRVTASKGRGNPPLHIVAADGDVTRCTVERLTHQCVRVTPIKKVPPHARRRPLALCLGGVGRRRAAPQAAHPPTLHPPRGRTKIEIFRGVRPRCAAARGAALPAGARARFAWGKVARAPFSHAGCVEFRQAVAGGKIRLAACGCSAERDAAAGDICGRCARLLHGEPQVYFLVLLCKRAFMERLKIG